MSNRSVSVFVASAGLAIAGAAQAGATIPVNQDLGALNGVLNVSGNTANGQDSVAYYLGPTNPLGNWRNEFVYSFTASALGRFELTLNSQSADTDFFLLSGLGIGNDGSKNFATDTIGNQFLDGALPATGGFGLLVPGQTYYLSVETWGGTDAAPTGDVSSMYNIDLNLVTEGGGTAPSAFIDLGAIANEFEAINVNTNGSSIDTEIGIWTSTGLLIANDDDGGNGTQSLIDFAGGLPAGDYYVALGEFNTTFADGFSASGGDASGDWVIDANGSTSGGTLGTGEIQFLRFTVVPTPGAVGLLGLAGLAGVRRRR